MNEHLDLNHEQEILCLVAAGDAAAFRTLYLHYYDRLFQFATLFLHSAEASEDAVSDVFFNLWKERHRLTAVPNFRSYIYRSVRNACLNTLKSGYVSKRDDLTATEAEMQVVLPRNNPLDELSYQELRHAVQQAVNDLPERCRMVFKMRREDELSHREIADILGITVRTVERQMMLAKEKIREALKRFL
ncbi:MAG: RNA polymerase sigma-70 factor [Mediterranea sp.]|nr:RNA polymerase sigma-70 factor [Mediterranea sp.]